MKRIRDMVKDVRGGVGSSGMQAQSLCDKVEARDLLKVERRAGSVRPQLGASFNQRALSRRRWGPQMSDDGVVWPDRGPSSCPCERASSQNL